MSDWGTVVSSVGVTLANNEHGRIGSWSPGIGDPSVIGWLTVGGYFLAALSCARAARTIRRHISHCQGSETFLIDWWRPVWVALLGGRATMQTFSPLSRLHALWISVAVVMLGLGINKQLDLQTAFAEAGRWLSRTQGWYDKRRLVQVVFIALVMVSGLWTLRALFVLARGQTREQTRSLAGVLAGAIFLCCFVAIRASSFHHVDELLGWAPAGVRVNAALELSGITCVILGSWRGQRPLPTAVTTARRAIS